MKLCIVENGFIEKSTIARQKYLCVKMSLPITVQFADKRPLAWELHNGQEFTNIITKYVSESNAFYAADISERHTVVIPSKFAKVECRDGANIYSCNIWGHENVTIQMVCDSVCNMYKTRGYATRPLRLFLMMAYPMDQVVRIEFM
jgi:hypothetical protein